MISKLSSLFSIAILFILSPSLSAQQEQLQLRNDQALKKFQQKFPYNYLHSFDLLEELTPPESPIPKRFDESELALFCKIEWKLEKTARMPIKFRLGEVQQVELKEGKMKSNYDPKFGYSFAPNSKKDRLEKKE